MKRVYDFTRRFFLLLFFIPLFMLLIPMGVYADDCISDPLNAADCMRTPGFRQGITIGLGVTATTGVILTNIIGQNVVPGTLPIKPPVPKRKTPISPQQPAQSPIKKPPVPQQPPKQVFQQPLPKQPPKKDDDSFFNFNNFKRLVDYPNKITQVLDKFKFTPDAIEQWKAARKMWKHLPNKKTAELYIDATKKRMNPTGRVGKYLDKAGKIMDAVDAVIKAENVIQKRGYQGWEKAGAYYVEGANKVIITVLTKNPVVSVIDQVAGDLTGHNIENTIRAGEEKWHQVTKEYAENIYNTDALDAEIATKDQGLRYIRKIRKLMDEGKINRDEGRKRARAIYDKMIR